MKKIFAVTSFALVLISACNSTRMNTQSSLFPKFSTEAHRGGRGLMPENTIPAMLHAVDMDVTTLEMDTHVSSDGKVILAHDHYINPSFMLNEDGKEIPEMDDKKYILYQMKYDQIRKFDVGSKVNSRFPEQKKFKVHIPLLSEVIDSVQTFIKENNRKQVFYNIETKSVAGGDNKLHPDPEKFVDLLVEVLEDKKLIPWVVIQSFDVRTLQVLNRKYPKIKTSFLIENARPLEENLKTLGYTPFIISPNAKLVTHEFITKAHQQNMKVIPWTVNTKNEIDKLKALGVDGIISDYPNLFRN